jgi:hypothetical protein
MPDRFVRHRLNPLDARPFSAPHGPSIYCGAAVKYCGAAVQTRAPSHTRRVRRPTNVLDLPELEPQRHLLSAAKHVAAFAVGLADSGYVWTPQGIVTLQMPEDNQCVSCVDIRSDAQRVALGARTDWLGVFDAATGRHLATMLRRPERLAPRRACTHFSRWQAPDIVLAGLRRDVVVWDTRSAAAPANLWRTPNPVASIDLHPDGRTVVTSHAESETVCLWDMRRATGPVRRIDAAISVTAVTADTGATAFAAFQPACDHALYTAGSAGLRRWNLNGRLLQTVPMAAADSDAGPSPALSSLSVHPSGTHCAVSRKNAMRVWQLVPYRGGRIVPERQWSIVPEDEGAILDTRFWTGSDKLGRTRRNMGGASLLSTRETERLHVDYLCGAAAATPAATPVAAPQKRKHGKCCSSSSSNGGADKEDRAPAPAPAPAVDALRSSATDTRKRWSCRVSLR